MCKGKGKKETKMALSNRKIEKIKNDLAKVTELKKALGMKVHNPDLDPSDFSLLVYLKLGDISGKIWWLLGSFAVTAILLVIILNCVLGLGGGS